MCTGRMVGPPLEARGNYTGEGTPGVVKLLMTGNGFIFLEILLGLSLTLIISFIYFLTFKKIFRIQPIFVTVTVFRHIAHLNSLPSKCLI